MLSVMNNLYSLNYFWIISLKLSNLVESPRDESTTGEIKKEKESEATIQVI